ncbi:hypothetical protein LIER_17186 [Lithospermum erythrorhizon]|uniref:Uncharacterized protein n=1 Tax=Lithospermum erythrorhizon TaxID=34254 RepID=A0AAV3QBI9_LITER
MDEFNEALENYWLTDLGSEVSHLALTHSDHSPILVELSSDHLHNKASFKFQNMWTTHKDFIRVVTDVWKLHTDKQGIGNFVEKLHRLKMELKQWNINEFGNISVELQMAEVHVLLKEREFELLGSE